MKTFDVVILGGGILGLVAARELLKSKYTVALVEKQNDFGGALASIERDGYTIEAFYHHIFPQDKTIIEIISQLGLKKKLLWKQARTGFLYDKAVYPLKGPLDLLKFKPLNWKEKLGFLKVMVSIKITDSKKLDNISASEWIQKKGGKGVYSKIFKTLLISKFGKSINEVSAAWFVERIKLRSNTGNQGEILGYLQGGFQQIIDKILKEVKELGGEIFTNTSVVSANVDSRTKTITRIKTDKQDFNAKCVVSSLPPKVLNSIMVFPKKYQEKLKKLDYQGAVCILVGLKKKITRDYYWINIMKENSFGALVEHTNYIPKRLYKNQTIIYLGSYYSQKDSVWLKGESEIFNKYFQDLQSLFPHIKKSDVLWYKISRIKNAGLIYKEGILKNIPKITTPVPNLFIGGMFNSYPERSINLSSKIGLSIAKKSDEYLKKGK